MSGTAAHLVRAFAAVSKMPFSTAESYAIALGKGGWWEKAKRGKGARPKSDMDAAKYLLAVLSAGPNDLRGFFITYANMRPVINAAEAPIVDGIRRILGLSDDFAFLDFAESIVRLYRKGSSDRLLWHRPSDEGFLGEGVVDVPQCQMRIAGPVPQGSFTFMLSASLIDELAAAGNDQETLLGSKSIHFAHEFVAQAADAMRQGDEEAALAFGNAFRAICDNASGVRFERYIDGAEISAVAGALVKEERG